MILPLDWYCLLLFGEERFPLILIPLCNFRHFSGLEDDYEMSGFTTAQTQVRILLRDISGKFVWDTSVLYTPAQVRVPPPSWEGVTSGGSYAPYQAPNVLSPPRHTKRHRHPEELPTFEVG